jgi:DNA-binding IclR family transcriptional regulator
MAGKARIKIDDAPLPAVNAVSRDKRENSFSPVKPVSNAIDILRYLNKLRRPATVTQIARQLEINPSTCFSILRTLVWEGLLEFDGHAKSYEVGTGMTKLAEAALSERQRLEALKPEFRSVAERYGVTMMLWRRSGEDRMLLVSTENCSGNVQIHLPTGQRLPLLLGASGRAAAGHLGLTKLQIRQKFQSLRWSRPLPFEDYWRDVQTAARRGWAYDDGYYKAGVMTVAVPVFDGVNRVSHILVAIMFRGQLELKAIERLGSRLIRLSSELTHELFPK